MAFPVLLKMWEKTMKDADETIGITEDVSALLNPGAIQAQAANPNPDQDKK